MPRVKDTSLALELQALGDEPNLELRIAHLERVLAQYLRDQVNESRSVSAGVALSDLFGHTDGLPASLLAT